MIHSRDRNTLDTDRDLNFKLEHAIKISNLQTLLLLSFPLVFSSVAAASCDSAQTRLVDMSPETAALVFHERVEVKKPEGEIALFENEKFFCRLTFQRDRIPSSIPAGNLKLDMKLPSVRPDSVYFMAEKNLYRAVFFCESKNKEDLQSIFVSEIAAAPIQNPITLALCPD